VSTLRSKTFLAIVLFSAIILQGLIPFLHAHTGASSKSGLHVHVVSTGYESATEGKLSISNIDSESPEIGVPAARQSDQLDFQLANLYLLAAFCLVLFTHLLQQAFVAFNPGVIARRIYRQGCLPPAIAPPSSL